MRRRPVATDQMARVWSFLDQGSSEARWHWLAWSCTTGPAGLICTACWQYRICPAQLGIFALQLADPGCVRARGPRPLAGIDLGLLDPAAQRIAVDSQLLTDPPTRRRDAPSLSGDVQDQADRPLPQLIRILPRPRS